MAPYPAVFLAKEGKCLEKGFWEAVGVYKWDAQALGCLLVRV